jgi:hypothetical protein
MGNTTRQAALFAIVVGVLLSVPLAMSAQDTAHKKKARSAPPSTSTNGVTGAKGTTKSGGKNKSFEIKDFSFGVENPTTTGSAKSGTGAGKSSVSEITVTKTKTTEPIYKGPLPPASSPPKPNDSAHKKPPH